MPDTRPAIILIVSLVAMVTIQIFASTGNPADKSKTRFRPHEPRVSVRVLGEDTATVGKTTTYEVKVKIESRDTTATIVDISDRVDFLGGAALEVADATPSVLNTESIGGGIKINWGKFQLVGGEELKIRLKTRSKREGLAVNTAVIKRENGEAMLSNNLTTIMVPPPVESTSTTSTTSTAFGVNPQPGQLSDVSATDSSGKSAGADIVTGKGASSSDSSLTDSRASSNDRIGFNGWDNNWDFGSEESTSSVGKVEKKTAFNDISPGEWFVSDIGDLVIWDIICGYPDNSFRPAEAVSRAEFTALIMRGAGELKRGPEPFADVHVDDWFYPVVASAYNLELVAGVSRDMFKPDDKLAREQAATIAVKVAKLPVDSDFEEHGSWLQGFSDRYAISEWARPFVAAAFKYNLIKGYVDDRFRPQGFITRAEAIALIHRLFFEKRSMLIETPDYTKPLAANPMEETRTPGGSTKSSAMQDDFLDSLPGSEDVSSVIDQ